MKTIFFWLSTCFFLAINYVMAGGHLHVLFQPFSLMMITLPVWCYVIYRLGFIGSFKFVQRLIANAQNSDDTDVLNNCISLTVLYGIIGAIMGLVHTFGYLDQGAATIGEHIGASMISCVYSLLFAALLIPLRRRSASIQAEMNSNDSMPRKVVGYSAVCMCTAYGTFGYLLWLLTAQYSPPVSAAIPKDAPIGNSVKIGEHSVVYSHWFFVVPAGLGQNGMDSAAKEFRVHNGEEFGFKQLFVSKKSKVKIQIKLTVPGSPENFPCGSCEPGELTISPDRRSVNVEYDRDTSSGMMAFFWGIDSKDPRGNYKLEFAVDGVPVGSYPFNVE